MEVFEYEKFTGFEEVGSFLYFNILCQLPVFLLGMSLYFTTLILKKSVVYDKWKLFISFIGCTLIALFTFVYLDRQISLLPFLPAVSFYFLFLLFKEVPFLSNKPLARIGQLSFSIYLFHFIITYEGSRVLNHLFGSYIASDILYIINIIITLILTTAVAILSEKYIEKPGIELGKKIIKRVKNKKTEAAYN